jgi:hypothetical protein
MELAQLVFVAGNWFSVHNQVASRKTNNATFKQWNIKEGSGEKPYLSGLQW